MLQPQQTPPEVSKHNKSKQRCASGLDEFRWAVNLILNYYDFDCAINSIFCMACAYLEASSCSLNTLSEVGEIVAAIMLHQCESRHKREVNVQRLGL